MAAYHFHGVIWRRAWKWWGRRRAYVLTITIQRWDKPHDTGTN